MHNLKFFIYLSSLFFFFKTNAQNSTNTWIFGSRTGLNFSVLPPQPIPGNTTVVEGSSCLSDGNGNLLFYTQGRSIFDRNFNVVQGGDNLSGDVSSTCNSLIIAKPGNDSLFYVFTVGAVGKPEQGFRYTVLNINANNGLGKVVLRNIFASGDAYEKIAAVRHCNNKDVWITIKIWDTDEYHTYLLDENGLSTTFNVVHTGFVVSGAEVNGIGWMKYSADGKRMAAAHSFEINKVEVMEFDNTTGVLYNPILLQPHTGTYSRQIPGVYGVAFSPNGKLLYISAAIDIAKESILYQYDVNTMTPAAVTGSMQIISINHTFNAGALQEARDGKIYFSHLFDTSLSIIHSPNTPGLGCNFESRGISFKLFGGQPLQYGLPGFVASDVNPDFAPYDFNYTTECDNLDMHFSINRSSGIDSVHWYFHDGSESLLLAPDKTYPSRDTFLVRLKVFRSNCSGAGFEEIVRSVNFPEPPTIFLPIDSTVCNFEPFTIASTVVAEQYEWNDGSILSAIAINSPGDYWLTIVKGGCVYSDTFKLRQSPAVSVDLGVDTTVCVSKPITFSVADQSLMYAWNTGSTNSTIEINKAGLYYVDVRNRYGCMASDSVKVEWGDCDFVFPNAFSPDNNNLNDYFFLLNGLKTNYYRIKIFNRYGEVVYQSNDPFGKWDGNFKGKPQPAGVYVWVVEYEKKKFINTEKGTVSIIR